MTTTEIPFRDFETTNDTLTHKDMTHTIGQWITGLNPDETMRVNGQEITYAVAPASVLAVIEGRRWAVAETLGLDDAAARELSIAEVNAQYFSIVP